MDNLPSDWKIVSLEDVCRAQSGGTPSRSRPDYYDGKIPWAKIEDLTRAGMWIESTEEHINETALEETSARIFPPGTVLLAMYGSIGTASIAKVPISTNQAIIGCQCNIKINPVFLYYLLQHIKKDLLISGRGGTQVNLNAQMVKELKIPLPSLSEQVQIVSFLDSYMERVTYARAAAEVQLEAANALQPAFLRTIFESRDVDSWEKKPLGDVGDIVSGITLGRKLNGSWTRKIPYLRVANVKDGYLDLSNIYNIDASEKEIRN